MVMTEKKLKAVRNAIAKGEKATTTQKRLVVSRSAYYRIKAGESYKGVK